MSTTTTYRIDIDGTIANPQFFHDDFQQCVNWYCDTGIVTRDEVAAFTMHQQLYLLPHVLLTHKPVDGAVQTLSRLVEQGETLQYFTVRQAIDPVMCRMVHGNTRSWLERHRFPCASAVSFFWDAGEKLAQSLEAPEDQIILIDDRPAGLLTSYETICRNNAEKAKHIRERVVLLAFGMSDLYALPKSSELRVLPLPSWNDFERVSLE